MLSVKMMRTVMSEVADGVLVVKRYLQSHHNCRHHHFSRGIIHYVVKYTF